MSKHQTDEIKRYERKGYFVINLIKTNKNGIPDLLALKKGEPPIFIECKEKHDYLSELQKYRLRELNKLGFIAFESKKK